MREWNPKEMKLLFTENAKEKGCSLRNYLKIFVDDLSVPIHYSTMERYFMENSKGPKSSSVKISLYEKIEKDFAYPMFETSSKNADKEIFIEDREKKIPYFCQKKLEEAFSNILKFVKDAYNGKYTLLFESDYSQLMYLYVIYKPCAPNYLCCEIQEFFKKMMHEIRKEANNSGIIIYENMGFCYQDELSEGEMPDIDDCELAEDYIENNKEEHRERVRRFTNDISKFWEINVERLYTMGEGQAKKVNKYFEEYYINEKSHE